MLGTGRPAFFHSLFHLRDYLDSLGWTVELQEVAAGQSNVIAYLNEMPRVWLSTHMDTVPPFIAPTEDDEKIYGRGSCDAKGIIAAQIIAAEELRSQGVEDIGLLFTVDEIFTFRGYRMVIRDLCPGRSPFFLDRV